jgi:hypothetical protein
VLLWVSRHSKQGVGGQGVAGVGQLEPLVLVDGGLQSVVGDVSRVGADFGTGRHNIGKLLSVVEENREEFSLQALERRLSKKLTSAEVAKYLKQVHEVSEANVDELKREVDKWRGVYQQDYKDIRDKVFAHRVMSSLDEMKEPASRI